MQRNRKAPNAPGLKAVLEQLRSSYSAEYIETDPVMFVHRYTSFGDRETAAAIASALSFGSVVQIKRSIGDVLNRMDGEPFRYIRELNPARAKRDFGSFVHRFIRGWEFACFLCLLSQVYKIYGSLYTLFMEGYDRKAITIEAALSRFVRTVYSMDCSPFYAGGVLPRESRTRFLFTSPEAGSACKRMNMFLRWMVRRGDDIDFGLWQTVLPAQLVMPLDTHVARIARCIGLSHYRVTSWRMALEVTGNLRRIDADDPVKYDFAFSRLGILGVCGTRGHRSDACPLKDICTCTGEFDG